MLAGALRTACSLVLCAAASADDGAGVGAAVSLVFAGGVSETCVVCSGLPQAVSFKTTVAKNAAGYFMMHARMCLVCLIVRGVWFGVPRVVPNGTAN